MCALFPFGIVDWLRIGFTYQICRQFNGFLPGAETMLDRPDLQKQITEKMLDHRAGERGLLGRLFGTKDHAPMNIAGIVLVSLVALLVVVIVAPLDPSVPRGSLITALFGAITFGLGLVLGARRKSDGE